MLALIWPRRAVTIVVVMLVALSAGCAHSSSRVPRQRGFDRGGSASTITRPQIDSLMMLYANAYDLIHIARPNMLVSRDVRLPLPIREGAQADPSGVKVFLDDVYIGGIEMLRRVPSRSIILVQHLSPSDATTRYGSGMVAGVIAITTGAARYR